VFLVESDSRESARIVAKEIVNKLFPSYKHKIHVGSNQVVKESDDLVNDFDFVKESKLSND